MPMSVPGIGSHVTDDLLGWQSPEAHIAFRHPAAAILLALVLFNLVHGELLKILKNLDFYHSHCLPLPGSCQPALSILIQVITNRVCQDRSQSLCYPLWSPSGWPHSLDTVFQWSEAHPVVLSPSLCSPLVHKVQWRKLLDVLLKSRYTSSAIYFLRKG